MKSLLYSRKFWIAVFGVVQALVFHYLEVPDEIWQSIAGLAMVLIGSIALEDAAAKHAPVVDGYEEGYQEGVEDARPVDYDVDGNGYTQYVQDMSAPTNS